MPDIHQNATRITLECVAGKDENRRIVIEDRPIRIAHAALQPALAVSEMMPGQGYLSARVENGQLLLDAHNCLLPIFLNNREIMTTFMREEDVLRIGNSTWRAHPAATAAAGPNATRPATDRADFSRPDANAARPDAARHAAAAAGPAAGPAAGAGANRPVDLGDRFSDLIGLEALKDFKLGEVFSEVFKKHTQEEMEEQLITGTARHTPSLAELAVGWAKPWLFARLLAVSALLALVLYIAFGFFHNIKLVPGLIFVGSFAVPVSTLIFFLEMNVPRNISIFKMTQLLFVGGVASIFVALIFFNRLSLLSFLGASAAGIIEESAKLLIVILLMGNTGRYHWVFNGLLFGAAVGTGFAAFESAGYALEDMLGANSVDAGVASILLRGINAPFTHIIWTANSAAALWLVKGDRPFSWSMLQSPVFLRVFISSMLLHMCWNAPFTLVPLPLVLDLKFVILGVLGWVITLRLVQTGLRQLSKARRDAGLTTMSISTIPPGLLQQRDNDIQRETQRLTRP
jgi:RsiW-degrading membrane proteinase PrsW (M82 family)